MSIMKALTRASIELEALWRAESREETSRVVETLRRWYHALIGDAVSTRREPARVALETFAPREEEEEELARSEVLMNEDQLAMWEPPMLGMAVDE